MRGNREGIVCGNAALCGPEGGKPVALNDPRQRAMIAFERRQHVSRACSDQTRPRCMAPEHCHHRRQSLRVHRFAVTAAVQSIVEMDHLVPLRAQDQRDLFQQRGIAE
jgi:hypothetical protein